MTSMSGNPTPQPFDQLVKRALPLLPVYVLIPLLFGLAFQWSGTGLSWRAFGLGALGWMIALFLRGPIGALSLKLPPERVKIWVVASSGPLEECTRLVLLLLTGTGFSWALSVGQGWAAVEVVYTIVQVVAIASLANRTDEKAQQAKAMLEAQGTLGASPLWGLWERVFASALHIGFTLLIARYPLLVIALIPLHSATNLIAVRMLKRSVVGLELAIAAVGGVALAAGLLVF